MGGVRREGGSSEYLVTLGLSQELRRARDQAQRAGVGVGVGLGSLMKRSPRW